MSDRCPSCGAELDGTLVKSERELRIAQAERDGDWPLVFQLLEEAAAEAKERRRMLICAPDFTIVGAEAPPEKAQC